MINLVVNNLFKHIKGTFDSYGLMSDIKFSSDVEMISEYTKSFRIRSLMQDYKLINDEEMTNLVSNPNYLVGLYNRSSLQIIEGIQNNIRLDTLSYDKNTNMDVGLEVFNDFKTKYEPIGIEIRNAVAGSINIKCKILTANSNTLEMLEYIVMDKLIKNNPVINVVVNLGEDIEPLEFDYNTVFSEIDEYGLIDTRNYGDLQQISFNVNVYGIFLSMFNKHERSISEVEFVTELQYPSSDAIKLR